MHDVATGPSASEIRALQAVVEYGTVKAAAEALHLSVHTIDAHVDSLRRKSGHHKIPQVVAWAAANGWLTAW
jgi:DNA-binding CsgD family transcriptional regulator